MSLLTRRTALLGLLAAPAVVAASNLMPISSRKQWLGPHSFVPNERIGYVRWNPLLDAVLYSPSGEYETWKELRGVLDLERGVFRPWEPPSRELTLKALDYITSQGPLPDDL